MKRKPGPIVPITFPRIEMDRLCAKCERKHAFMGSAFCTECDPPKPTSTAKRPCNVCNFGETWRKKCCSLCGAMVQYTPKAPAAKRELEAPIKERTRKALIAAGAIVWVHDIDNRQMKTGLGTGTSDLICIAPPHGRFLAIEMKRPGYSPSDVTHAQRCFLAVVRQFGGVSGIATCEAEALALLAEAAQECLMRQARP